MAYRLRESNSQTVFSGHGVRYIYYTSMGFPLFISNLTWHGFVHFKQYLARSYRTEKICTNKQLFKLHGNTFSADSSH